MWEAEDAAIPAWVNRLPTTILSTAHMAEYVDYVGGTGLIWFGFGLPFAIRVSVFEGCVQERLTVADPDTVLLARLLYGENQHIDPEEALLIGDSVLNRVGLPHYPDTLADVILQPNQYSPFNPSDPNYKRVMQFGENHPRWAEYASYAQRILEPKRKRSAVTHYFSSTPPKWASSMVGLAKKGAHWFGQEDPESRRKPLKIAVADAFMRND